MPLIKLCLVASLLAVVPLSAVCGRVQQHQTDIHESSDNLISQTGQIHNEQSDAIDSVPGFDGDLPIFYYLVETESDPSNAPVVLWLNGGPGCSSFDGFVYEQGPFNFVLDATNAGQRVKLVLNPYAWNKVANMIFLDSPAGVGLSYSQAGSKDYRTDDMVTAADAEEFLRKWFVRHSRFQGSEFFISGESYAGVYVPNLARAVVEGNDRGSQPPINIQGYLVGNPVTDEEADGNALPLFASGKALVSHALYEQLWRVCDGGNFWNASFGSSCDRGLDKLVDIVARLNVYDVLEPCYTGPNFDHSSSDSELKPMEQEGTGLTTMQKALKTHGRQWPLLGAVPKVGQRVHNWHSLGLTPPCLDARAASLWLNDESVRAAIHAQPRRVIGDWTVCSNHLFYKRVIPSLIPIHKDLTQKRGLRALVYSGDHDMAVPHTGSEVWTATLLGGNETAPWRPWMVAGQVAGFVVDYGRLSYATVKGAGHMVPTNKPQESLAMLKRFLDAKPLA